MITISCSNPENVANQIKDWITENLPGGGVIAIAGGSCSGKTLISKQLKLIMDDAVLISMNDYYHSTRNVLKTQRVYSSKDINWDRKDSIKIAPFKRDIAKLKEGHPIMKPCYSFLKGYSTGETVVEPKKYVIIEGLYAIAPDIRNLSDVRIYVKSSTMSRITRRIERDVKRHHRSVFQVLRRSILFTEPYHRKHVRVTQFPLENVTIFVKNTMSFREMINCLLQTTSKDQQ